MRRGFCLSDEARCCSDHSWLRWHRPRTAQTLQDQKVKKLKKPTIGGIGKNSHFAVFQNTISAKSPKCNQSANWPKLVELNCAADQSEKCGLIQKLDPAQNSTKHEHGSDRLKKKRHGFQHELEPPSQYSDRSAPAQMNPPTGEFRAATPTTRQPRCC